MRTTITFACGALALALTAAVAPALAGGSIKDGNAAAVPVPAPNPIPDYYGNYYLRLDAAYSWADADRFDTGNDLYNQNRRRDDGLSESGRFGFGVGMYMTKWLRTDVTFDTREEATGYVRDVVTYTSGAGDDITDTLTDSIRYRNYTGLANLYVDLPFTPKFTPYIGGGVGLVVHSMSRSLNQTVSCVPNLGTCAGYPIDNAVGDKNYQYALAGALMGGFAYQLSDSIKADVGYRWLHLDGASFSHWVGEQMAFQTVKIPSQNIHEMRIGLRWDIN